MRNNKLGVKLVETESLIKLIKDNTDHSFNIPRSTLGMTILIKNKIYSEWIHILKYKSWVPNELLYQLSEIIERDYSNENIDWLIQFSEIEWINLNYKKFQKNQFIKKDNITLSNFLNSPYILIPDMKRKDLDRLIVVLIKKFEPWGMNERMISR